MICKKCGTKNYKGRKSCRKCGSTLTETKTKKVWFVLIPVVVAVAVLAAVLVLTGSKGDFRDVKWGMTKQQVIDSEAKRGNSNYKEEGNILTYSSQNVLGYDNWSITYQFEGGSLISLDCKLDNPSSSQIKADVLLDKLQKEYGQTAETSLDIIVWDTPETIISFNSGKSSGGSGDVYTVNYTSKNFITNALGAMTGGTNK